MADGTRRTDRGTADSLLEDLLTEYVLDGASHIGPLHGADCCRETLNDNIYYKEDINHGRI